MLVLILVHCIIHIQTILVKISQLVKIKKKNEFTFHSPHLTFSFYRLIDEVKFDYLYL